MTNGNIPVTVHVHRRILFKRHFAILSYPNPNPNPNPNRLAAAVVVVVVRPAPGAAGLPGSLPMGAPGGPRLSHDEHAQRQ